MKAPRNAPRPDQRRNLSHHADRLLTLFLVVSIGAFSSVNFGAKASEGPGDQNSREASASAGAETSSPGTADYRLSPGDRLTIVVFDQPQLSGEFIIDGGGGFLLPLAGNVSVKGLTLAEAQQLIKERYADGVLVAPAVSVRITKYKPIFVTGKVRQPGSYSYILGESVKAAVAAAGGVGPRLDTSAEDVITAAQRVRQLESDQAILLIRKARLEAQRDGRENFVMPLLVGLDRRYVDFNRAYSAESEMFLGLADSYRRQMEAVEAQRPRIEAETKAVNDQIARQKERLDIVNSRLADLELLFGKGLLRKDVLVNQQIERVLVEGQLSNLEAQVARLRQATGDLDIRLGDLKGTYERQILAELQDTSQRLLETENSIGAARKILGIKSDAANGDRDDPEYAVFISRERDGRLVTFEASEDSTLSPGDVVSVKLKRRDSDGDLPSSSTEAATEFDPTLPEIQVKGSLTSNR